MKDDIKNILIDRGVEVNSAKECADHISNRICDLVRECRTRTVLVPCPYCMHNTTTNIVVGETDTTTISMQCQDCKTHLVITAATDTIITRIVPKDGPVRREEQLKLDLHE